MKYRTKQEAFWVGQGGDEYIKRNSNPKIVASNVAFFSRVLRRTSGILSVIEFGANIGLNLMAIQQLMGHVEAFAVEINSEAAKNLQSQGICNVSEQSIFDYNCPFGRDLVISKGLLIHINPAYIEKAYEIIYDASNKYILLAEYYNPVPVEVEYRGHRDRLFKRDFAGEMMDIYPDLELIDYGFVYHRDPNFPQGDMTWFLMQKR